MTQAAPPVPTRFWPILRLLLAAARRRARGRRRRQGELLSQRAGKRSVRWRGLGFAGLVILTTMLHLATVLLIVLAVQSGADDPPAHDGRIAVDPWFYARARDGGLRDPWVDRAPPPNAADRAFRIEAARIARRENGNPAAIAARLHNAVQATGAAQLRALGSTATLRTLYQGGPLPALFGSLIVVVWSIMLVLQGEGLELDIQRRRHPMWEWLFSHPVPAAAVFAAEMLAPIAANPIYYSAPLVPGLLYAMTYGWKAGLLACVLAGIPITVAAACLGKALEIAVILRFSVRSRGAMAGFMGWLGYASMVGLVMAAGSAGRVFTALAPTLAPVAAAIPLPLLGLLLGVQAGGASLLRGILTSLAIAAVVIAGSVRFSIWGAQRGLMAPPDTAPAAPARASARFSRNPFYAKEMLWFMRDRSALIQVFLIPLSLSGYQLLNLHNMLIRTQNSWSVMSGAAILFGTYFLLVLGPKSLASEGAALWIALTWPRGLESLLHAKAWLWTWLSSIMVALVLAVAAVIYPHDAWKIALVAIAWFAFARSMAAKATTLATITTESGEIQKVPLGRRLAANLGVASFSIGIFTQQWSLAVLGVGYSMMTASAMWQNFRARLPYLYDPWSETRPHPPTLMHAMIAISALVEVGAVSAAIAAQFLARDQIAIVRAALYGVCAGGVSLGMLYFLHRRGVRATNLWCWQRTPADAHAAAFWRTLAAAGFAGLLACLATAAVLGTMLAACATFYVAVLGHFPLTATWLHQTNANIPALPHLHTALLIMAVGIAPWAEEFLFRGLLYRALDREWGGWRAIAGSAGFFAIYHPPIAWVPVFLLGAMNALLFKRTGRLAPCIVAHMVYNAIVLT